MACGKSSAVGGGGGTSSLGAAFTRLGRSILSGVRMRQRRLGGHGLVVSSLGLGCMGMSEFYGALDDAESVATIHRALDLGITLLDTADVYGPHTNERPVGRANAGQRDAIVLATKFGIIRGPDPKSRGVTGRPEYVRASCDPSIPPLRLHHSDQYYQQRLDPK